MATGFAAAARGDVVLHFICDYSNKAAAPTHGVRLGHARPLSRSPTAAMMKSCLSISGPVRGQCAFQVETARRDSRWWRSTICRNADDSWDSALETISVSPATIILGRIHSTRGHTPMNGLLPRVSSIETCPNHRCGAGIEYRREKTADEFRPSTQGVE